MSSFFFQTKYSANPSKQFCGVYSELKLICGRLFFNSLQIGCSPLVLYRTIIYYYKEKGVKFSLVTFAWRSTSL
jgi:hypothetical protein